MKIFEDKTPALAAYYKGCMEGLDLLALSKANEHCLHVNEVNDLTAYFTMKEVLNDHICDEMGWSHA